MTVTTTRITGTGGTTEQPPGSASARKPSRRRRVPRQRSDVDLLDPAEPGLPSSTAAAHGRSRGLTTGRDGVPVRAPAPGRGTLGPPDPGPGRPRTRTGMGTTAMPTNEVRENFRWSGTSSPTGTTSTVSVRLRSPQRTVRCTESRGIEETRSLRRWTHSNRSEIRSAPPARSRHRGHLGPPHAATGTGVWTMVGFHGGVRASAVPNAPSVLPHRPRPQTVRRPTLDGRERESMTRAESHDGTSGEPVGTPAHPFRPSKIGETRRSSLIRSHVRVGGGQRVRWCSGSPIDPAGKVDRDALRQLIGQESAVGPCPRRRDFVPGTVLGGPNSPRFLPRR